MARTATTADAFNAIAEPKRRVVLGALAGGERTVTYIVELLGWPQPQVSKHLAVLRQVGLVSYRREGRERLYSVNGAPLKTIHDWTAMFEKFWQHQLEQIKARAEAKVQRTDPASAIPQPPTKKEN
jgi:DNA-binding transcriptional ArsR family regulator